MDYDIQRSSLSHAFSIFFHQYSVDFTPLPYILPHLLLQKDLLQISAHNDARLTYSS